jgi:AcrR family transcriptional regulator
MRADARRNREALLAAALTAFSEQAVQDVTLERVARDAGVGIGTLYRHFPTRDALIEEVYRHELARLCDAAGELLTELAPDAALRAWMDRFAGYLAAKRELAGALQVVIAAGGTPFAHSRERMVGAVAVLLEAGAGTSLRPDVTAEDVLVALSGITTASADPAQTARLLDLLVDALRPGLSVSTTRGGVGRRA